CGCFNPRPTRRPGATAVASQLGTIRNEFQSSPDPEAGRHVVLRPGRERVQAFQSPPDPEAGRHPRPPKVSKGPPSFNPRPTRRPGATARPAAVGRVTVVSILARPGGRAPR